MLLSALYSTVEVLFCFVVVVLPPNSLTLIQLQTTLLPSQRLAVTTKGKAETDSNYFWCLVGLFLCDLEC